MGKRPRRSSQANGTKQTVKKDSNQAKKVGNWQATQAKTEIVADYEAAILPIYRKSKEKVMMHICKM